MSRRFHEETSSAFGQAESTQTSPAVLSQVPAPSSFFHAHQLQNTQQQQQQQRFPPARKAKQHRRRHIPVGPAGIWFQQQQQQQQHPNNDTLGHAGKPGSSRARNDGMSSSSSLRSENNSKDIAAAIDEGDATFLLDDIHNHATRTSKKRHSGVAFYSPAWIRMQCDLQLVTPSLPAFLSPSERYSILRKHVPSRFLLLPDVLHHPCSTVASASSFSSAWKLEPPHPHQFLVLVQSIQSLTDHLWTVELTDETGAVMEAWMQPDLVRQEQQRPHHPRYIRTGLVWLVSQPTVMLAVHRTTSSSTVAAHHSDEEGYPSRQYHSSHGSGKWSRMLLIRESNILQVWTPGDDVSDDLYVQWSEKRNDLTTREPIPEPQDNDNDEDDEHHQDEEEGENHEEHGHDENSGDSQSVGSHQDDHTTFQAPSQTVQQQRQTQICGLRHPRVASDQPSSARPMHASSTERRKDYQESLTVLPHENGQGRPSQGLVNRQKRLIVQQSSAPSTVGFSMQSRNYSQAPQLHPVQQVDTNHSDLDSDDPNQSSQTNSIPASFKHREQARRKDNPDEAGKRLDLSRFAAHSNTADTSQASSTLPPPPSSLQRAGNTLETSPRATPADELSKQCGQARNATYANGTTPVGATHASSANKVDFAQFAAIAVDKQNVLSPNPRSSVVSTDSLTGKCTMKSGESITPKENAPNRKQQKRAHSSGNERKRSKSFRNECAPKTKPSQLWSALDTSILEMFDEEASEDGNTEPEESCSGRLCLSSTTATASTGSNKDNKVSSSALEAHNADALQKTPSFFNQATFSADDIADLSDED